MTTPAHLLMGAAAFDVYAAFAGALLPNISSFLLVRGKVFAIAASPAAGDRLCVSLRFVAEVDGVGQTRMCDAPFGRGTLDRQPTALFFAGR